MNYEARRVLNSFVPRPYQIPILDALENKEYKKIIAIMPRRAGKDMVAWNLAIRQCVKKTCIVYYIFPTYSQAKKVIWSSITNDGKQFLDFIPKELIASKNSQEMKIVFTNGSILQLIGSENIDSIVGTNPYGCVFSEYALQDPKAYQFIRPILAANDGWALFISCVSPDTLVITEDGFKRIKDVSKSRKEYSELNKPIFGLNGFNNATSFYYGGKQNTLRITLSTGYQIECTPIHPLWDGSDWVKAKDLRIGDELPVQYGQNVFGPGLSLAGFRNSNHHNILKKITKTALTEDFFYLLGVMCVDAHYTKLCVTTRNPKAKEILDAITTFGFKKFTIKNRHISKKTPSETYSSYFLASRNYCAFLKFLGFPRKSKERTIPDKLLECSKIQMKSFFQGLFEANGWTLNGKTTGLMVVFCSLGEKFVKDVQRILLNFGIVSFFKQAKYTRFKDVTTNIYYNLRITGYFAYVFLKEIGFRNKCNQDCEKLISEFVKEESGNIYSMDSNYIRSHYKRRIFQFPGRSARRHIAKIASEYNDPYLKSLIKEKFFYSKIKSIEESESEVFDFVIPSTHSFFSNGFISHNTPRGKNNFWELYQVAKHHPAWFAYKLTLDDTCHIPLKEIEREREEGIMSEDLIQQEYYTSFDLGVEGAYYVKYIDKMRLKGQIGDVPYETGFKVHTAWDIGVRDSTAIIFFQVIGQVVRIIDCYENAKVGLEHYVKVLAEKEYVYGKHIAPHDMKVKEFGSGMTRLEKAKQLGIKFIVAPSLSIQDGIESVRSCFSKVWIDERMGAPLIRALENYRQEYDSKKKVYFPHPLHNQFSHMADAMRYLAISLPKTRDGASAEDIDRNYREAMYGDGQLPPFFR